jgi:hypothetical protein
MKISQISEVSASILCPLLLFGCSQEPVTSVETIASAVRAVGYTCDSVKNSSQAPDGANWLVSCEDVRSYIANVAHDGSICVTPTPNTDAVVPVPMPEIPEKCVSANDI